MQQPRQDPVSCESCRKKKLKCSRDEPCSNCTTRKTPCVYSSCVVRTVAPSSAAVRDDLNDLREENTAIKARLARLEDLLCNDISTDPERPVKVRRLDTDKAIPTPSATPSSHQASERAKSYRSDVQWLEGVGTRENHRLPDISTGFTIHVEPISTIVQRASSGTLERCILLPLRYEAFHLYSAYVTQVDPMQHFTHGPTVMQSIRQLYDRLECGERVDPNETLLFTSIIASMASYWSSAADENAIFDSAHSATVAATFWLRQTLDVQEHVRRTASATLSTIQSYLGIVFLLYHMESFSPKVRSVFASALTCAKDLGLHQTDRDAPLQESPPDEVDKEIRRRVWWHIASTDWQFAIAGGPCEGTYNVNPKHMNVKMPRNVSDEELMTKPLDYEHDRSDPTIMGYHLQRIRLSQTSREITDLTWNMDQGNIPVDTVAELDAKLRLLLSELPPFLRVDSGGYGDLSSFEGTTRHVVLQRYMVNLALHSRRCKFHLPLLLRATSDPRYASSREACLESASAVMKLKSNLAKENGSLWISDSKLGGFIHLYFYATVVLLMDFCANRELVDEPMRKADLEQALRTMEQAKQQSPAANLFLGSLMAALSKHKIRLKSVPDEDAGTAINGSFANAHRTPSDGSSNRQVGSDAYQGAFNLDLDELWQSYIESDMTNDWNPLLTDIQTCAWE